MSDLPGFTREAVNARGVVAAGRREEVHQRLDAIDVALKNLAKELEELREQIKDSEP